MAQSYAVVEMHSLAVGLGRILFTLKLIVGMIGYALLVKLLEDWGEAAYEKCFWLLCFALLVATLKNVHSRRTLEALKVQIEIEKRTSLSSASLARQQRQHQQTAPAVVEKSILSEEDYNTLEEGISELRAAAKYVEARSKLTQLVEKYSNDTILVLLLKVINDEASSHRKGDEQKQSLSLGLQYSEKITSKSTENADGWRWKAVFLGRLSSYKGTKEKIADAYKIRDSARKALSLNGNDPISLHVLGAWCHGVAKITWIERQAAAAIFGTPPTSSVKEAMEYLSKADTIEPFMENSSLLGECYQELGDKVLSNKYFELAIQQANREGQSKDVTSQIEKIKQKMKKNT